MHMVTIIYASDGDECNLYYLTQPIQQLGCNTYRNLSKFSLECNTYAVQAVDYNILWYKSSNFTNDSVKVINAAETRVTIANTGVLGHKQSRLTLTNLTIMDMGEYWCQIALMENGTVSKVLESSQKAKLLHPEAYSKLLPCPNTFLHEFTTKCAERCNDSSNALSNTTTTTTTTTTTPTTTTTNDGSLFERQFCVQFWVAAAIAGGIGLVLLLCFTCWCVTVCTCAVQKTRITRSTKGKNKPGNVIIIINVTIKAIIYMAYATSSKFSIIIIFLSENKKKINYFVSWKKTIYSWNIFHGNGTKWYNYIPGI